MCYVIASVHVVLICTTDTKHAAFSPTPVKSLTPVDVEFPHITDTVHAAFTTPPWHMQSFCSPNKRVQEQPAASPPPPPKKKGGGGFGCKMLNDHGAHPGDRLQECGPCEPASSEMRSIQTDQQQATPPCVNHNHPHTRQPWTLCQPPANTANRVSEFRRHIPPKKKEGASGPSSRGTRP